MSAPTEAEQWKKMYYEMTYKRDELEAQVARLEAAAAKARESLEKISRMDGATFAQAWAKCLDEARAALAELEK